MIDVETGDYELGDDYLTPSHTLHERRPEAPLFALRVGYPTLARVGRPLLKRQEAIPDK